MSARSVVVGRDGRAKAYRPLPEAERAAALAAGIEAYEHGDFFEAHELLEPAWMGTDVAADRALLQGLIKLAAAYVHAVRGNPAGIARNLDRSTGSPGRGGRGTRRGRVADTVAGRPGTGRRHRPAARRSRGPPEPARYSGRPSYPGVRHDARPARCHRSTSPKRIGDSARTPHIRSCSTCARMNEFVEVRAPGALLLPTSALAARIERGPDRPTAPRRVPDRGSIGGRDRLPGAVGSLGRVQRDRRDGSLGACRVADPPRPNRPRRRRAPRGVIVPGVAGRRGAWRPIDAFHAIGAPRAPSAPIKR